ncbi:MAG: DUF4139 domain-containing protein [Myxococcota bacterium]
MFREGARVRRVAELSRTVTGPGSDSSDGDPEAAPGYPAAVCVTGLPLSLSDASVRVSVVGDHAQSDAVGPLPVAADARVTLDVPDTDSDLAPPVAEELEAARREVRQLEGTIAQVKRELSRLQRLGVTARPKSGASAAPLPSPVAARLALLELREQRERALRSELSEVLDRFQRATLTAKRLADAHQRATTARQAHEHELRKSVVVSLRRPVRLASDPASANGSGGSSESSPGSSSGDHGAAVPERVWLTIEYLVPGARWAPAYTVRLGERGRASFAMRAVVAQQTGEDWTGVELALSTADAQGWSELPRLASKRIGRRQPSPARTGWRPPPTGADALYGDYDRRFAADVRGVPTPTRTMDDEDAREITTPMRPYSGAGPAEFERRPTQEYEAGESANNLLDMDADEGAAGGGGPPVVARSAPAPDLAAPGAMPPPQPVANRAKGKAPRLGRPRGL